MKQYALGFGLVTVLAIFLCWFTKQPLIQFPGMIIVCWIVYIVLTAIKHFGNQFRDWRWNRNDRRTIQRNDAPHAVSDASDREG